MGRPSKIGGFKPHPHPRLKDKVQLRDKLRGETDLTWNARFLVNETWTKPVSLGTKDYEEAKEIARDKFVLAEAGADISAKAKKVEEHTVDKYADIAVKELEKAAADAAKVAKGKEFNFLDLARRIKTVIKPAFGTLDIKKLDTDKLNDWAKDYEVEDVAATKARYGDQKRGPGRQRVMKAPAVSTLGNIDRALKFVWEAAADAKIVNAKMRPMIDKDEFGADGEPRSFIDQHGVKAVYRVMSTDRYLYGNNGHTTDYKRMLRTYVALIATAGIRPGLELKRTRIGDIKYRQYNGRYVYIIHVRKNAGKYKKERNSIVYEGDVFPTSDWLADLLAWQEQRGAKWTDKLFAWNDDGDVPQFRDGLRDVLTEAACLTDPLTGDDRVAYSFGHYFATMLIDKGYPTAKIAAWMGTSEYMIHKHYDRYMTENDAYAFSGTDDASQHIAELLRKSATTALFIPTDDEATHRFIDEVLK